jgi:hypothetical protein
MKETFTYEEDVARLAISVTNELIRCACSHCIDIYIRGEEEHFLSKAKVNQIEIQSASNNTKDGYEQIDNNSRAKSSDRGKILSMV